MASKERPPLRVVISDPAAKGEAVKVKVVGNDEIPYGDTMRKTKEQDRSELPTSRLNSKLAAELKLGEAKVITLRFKTGDKKVKVPFRVEIDDKVPDGEVHVSSSLLSEVVGSTEAEGEAMRAMSWQIAVDENVAIRLAGLEVGDYVDGSLFGLKGLRLKIVGGSDATGLPMHPGVPGTGRWEVLLAGPPGYRPKRKGERRRKSVRGRMIPDPRVERRKTALAQLNLIIVNE
ncbi:MAG: 30S ribosomal protein S6e [Acidilobaceae archaeon]|nr:30S ribosomal protein S6e [Acidilobaceae archaeon]MCX8165601.1 30S ribosomal protein S6e [Acidilobaceae archaeon]MDW7974028.1 S6e family ribosomal protein [Sulfolobales archaeon]